VLRYSPSDVHPFAVGVGLTLSLTSSPLLITELAYPTLVSASFCTTSPCAIVGGLTLLPIQRGKMSGAYNASWYLGAIGTAWAVFGVYGSPDDQFTWRCVITHGLACTRN
jgi:hypothetical protein